MNSLQESINLWKERLEIIKNIKQDILELAHVGKKKKNVSPKLRISGTRIKFLDFVSENCPLCKKYEQCDGCPVSKKLDGRRCDSSPYWEVFILRIKGLTGSINRLAFISTIENEIRFLESLK